MFPRDGKRRTADSKGIGIGKSSGTGMRVGPNNHLAWSDHIFFKVLMANPGAAASCSLREMNLGFLRDVRLRFAKPRDCCYFFRRCACLAFLHQFQMVCKGPVVFWMGHVRRPPQPFP